MEFQFEFKSTDLNLNLFVIPRFNMHFDVFAGEKRRKETLSIHWNKKMAFKFRKFSDFLFIK